jgi:hypothetical protein
VGFNAIRAAGRSARRSGAPAIESPKPNQFSPPIEALVRPVISSCVHQASQPIGDYKTGYVRATCKFLSLSIDELFVLCVKI